MILMCLALSSAWSSAAGSDVVFAVFSADIAPYRQAFDGFKGVMQEKNGSLRIIECDLEKEGANGIVQRVMKERPHLVLTLGPAAAKFAKESISNTPVLYCMVLRPQPLAGPNITWVSMDVPPRAKMERIRKIFPAAGKIGMIYSPGSAILYREVVEGCKDLGFQMVGKKINSAEELPKAFNDMARQIDLFLMTPDTKIYFPESIKYLLTEGLRKKMPIIGLAPAYTRAGALLSFYADYLDLGRQAGEMALRIIDGVKPQDIEPAQPRKIKISVNLAVTEILGIKIDPKVIEEASDVFK